MNQRNFFPDLPGHALSVSRPQAAVPSLHPQHTPGGDPGDSLTRVLPPGLRVQQVPLPSS